MVSFTKGEIMAEPLERIEQRLERVEGKVEALDHRLGGLSQRVSEVSDEQRRYTDFAFERLRGEMLAGFSDVRQRLDGIEQRFDGLEQRFDGLGQRFDGLDGRLARVERKLDQFIDVQRATNQLVERRLNALESSPDR